MPRCDSASSWMLGAISSLLWPFSMPCPKCDRGAGPSASQGLLDARKPWIQPLAGTYHKRGTAFSANAAVGVDESVPTTTTLPWDPAGKAG